MSVFSKADMYRRYRKNSNLFELRTPEQQIYNMYDLIECGFVARRSVAYLDLSLCEFSNFKKKWQAKLMQSASVSDGIANRSRQLLIERKIFNTEESFKKYFAPNRKLLYDLHLDVSNELELSLRNFCPKKIRKCFSEHVFLNKIVLKSDMYESCLVRIIKQELQVNNQKIKLIGQLSKIAKRLRFLENDVELLKNGLTFLCFYRADSLVVKDFLTAMKFDDDYLFTLPIDIFEFVLHHTNQTGFNLWQNIYCNDPISASMSFKMFVKTESLFQYFDSPRLCDDVYITRVNCRWLIKEDELKILIENKLVTRARHFLIMQILLVYLNRSGMKALQMLWRSISDPFITLQELKLSLSGMPVPKFTELTSSFLPQVTGEDLPEGKGLHPRKLQHHCRAVIRRVLMNNRQLATGIDQLKLPTSLKSYIRLEN